jgi:hypothetical protein
MNNRKWNLENKFDKFIFGLLEGRENGDWNEYENGEEISYNFDLRNEEWIDLDFNIESLGNYIGEGIWIENYNVKIDNWDLIINNIN